MALVQKKAIFPAAEERRRFQRVKVHLLGRYMLADRREFPCQVINMSPGGLAMLARESIVIARWLDWTDRKLTDGWRKAKATWKKWGPAQRGALILALLLLVTATGSGAWVLCTR